MGRPTFGIMSYSFQRMRRMGAMDLFGYLETVKYRYGLDTADIWNAFLPAYDDKLAETLNWALAEKNLTVANLCCDGADLWDEDPDKREMLEKRALECIYLGEKIGAKTIRIDVGIRQGEFTEENLARIVPQYKKYCKMAAQFGAKLGPENHYGYSRKAECLEKLVKLVDEPNFGFLIHLGRWDDGVPAENDVKMAPYAMHVHIDVNYATHSQDTILKFKEAGYNGCWSIESNAANTSSEYATAEYVLSTIKRIVDPHVYPAFAYEERRRRA